MGIRTSSVRREIYERKGYAACGRGDRWTGDWRISAGGVPEVSCAIAERECTDDELGSVL